ncbi:MAG: hypothetical protein K2N72_01665, partial [Oscillospiraceae bacterium]|nr:hypothetical protein [Oscillospiraceae bacterium]
MKCDFVYEKLNFANDCSLPTKGTTSQGGEGALRACWGRRPPPSPPCAVFPLDSLSTRGLYTTGAADDAVSVDRG